MRLRHIAAASAVAAVAGDGDTVDVATPAGRVRVRMLGIDTPEVYGGVECYGRKASQLTKKLLPIGTDVQLVVGVEPVDRYGRALAWVSKGKQLVNVELVRRGASDVLLYEDRTYERQLKAAKKQALADGRGMWGECPKNKPAQKN